MQTPLPNVAVPRIVEHPGSPVSRKRNRPVVVDVDEVLGGAGDTAEPIVENRRLAPLRHAFTSVWRRRRDVADSLHFDPDQTSLNREVVAFLLRVVAEGRPVYLCSERHQEPLVMAVAEHLGVFVAWSATRAGNRPAEPATDLPFPLRDGFDYLGPLAIELPGVSSIPGPGPAIAETTRPGVGARSWMKLLRVHQYAKNALVLIPLLTAHKFALLPAATALSAALAFSLGASSAYILNDLLDVEADRAHPTKRNRPIASGAISPAWAIVALALALVAALAIASAISAEFTGVLIGYLVLTTAYSFWLKRVAIVDVLTLAILYTIRVAGGAVAISVVVSEWLFAFSLFIFTSLALVKRYIELDGRPEGGKLMARDYQASDKSIVAILAAAAGLNAVVILTLYISSESVRALYGHPQLLWAACPILMCWIARVMLMAHRGLIDDDPVIFALKDRFSWLALGLIGASVLAAI
jgi:4-hydroxybenzoate polyprenyltransferase